jgi:hypothetical protein
MKLVCLKPQLMRPDLFIAILRLTLYGMDVAGSRFSRVRANIPSLSG